MIRGQNRGRNAATACPGRRGEAEARPDGSPPLPTTLTAQPARTERHTTPRWVSIVLQFPAQRQDPRGSRIWITSVGFPQRPLSGRPASNPGETRPMKRSLLVLSCLALVLGSRLGLRIIRCPSSRPRRSTARWRSATAWRSATWTATASQTSCWPTSGRSSGIATATGRSSSWRPI